MKVENKKARAGKTSGAGLFMNEQLRGRLPILLDARGAKPGHAVLIDCFLPAKKLFDS